jgi:hypothetical protein
VGVGEGAGVGTASGVNKSEVMQAGVGCTSRVPAAFANSYVSTASVRSPASAEDLLAGALLARIASRSFRRQEICSSSVSAKTNKDFSSEHTLKLWGVDAISGGISSICLQGKAANGSGKNARIPQGWCEERGKEQGAHTRVHHGFWRATHRYRAQRQAPVQGVL